MREYWNIIILNSGVTGSVFSFQSLDLIHHIKKRQPNNICRGLTSLENVLTHSFFISPIMLVYKVVATKLKVMRYWEILNRFIIILPRLGFFKRSKVIFILIIN